MNMWYYLIIIPFAAGVFCLFLPQKLRAVSKIVAVAVSFLVFGFVISFFNATAADEFIVKDALSSFIILAVAFFGVVTVVYSLKYMADHERQNAYYSLILMTIGGAMAAALANDLIMLLLAWGFLALTLYLLIAIGSADSAPAAKKTLIIVGGTDALMLMGVLLVYFLAGSWKIGEIAGNPITFIAASATGAKITSFAAVTAFLFLVLGCFAKAGVIPLHTWIPDMAATSPASVMAFLPASLDKLLGIYLLSRVSLQLFSLTEGWRIFLMGIGAVTILSAVMMAMIQHDLRKLLAYHAVSQVGYMVLGIGCGSLIAIGVAGALFHMLNNCIYKSCLFLCGGAIEHRTRTNDLEKLGGLAGRMPLTFIACLIAALSISGIPPFNGFFSKWMIYQGLIDYGKAGGTTWVLWIVAAMFGSALTLASFAKLIYAAFLGQKLPEYKNVREVHFTMWVPMLVLALLCLVFGIFAVLLPIKYFIQPGMVALMGEKAMIKYSGIWWSGWATLMILGGIALGFVLYLLGNLKGFRRDAAYVGGEVFAEDARVTGVDFYGTVKDLPVLRRVYALAEGKVFDLYEQGKKLTFCISDKLKEAHTGILRTYLAWLLLGMLVLIIFLMMRI